MRLTVTIPMLGSGPSDSLIAPETAGSIRRGKPLAAVCEGDKTDPHGVAVKACRRPATVTL